MKQDLDDYDLLILKELQKDGHLTIKELAQKVHLSVSPVYERVRKLEREGYIQYEYISEELPDLFALSDMIVSRAGANAVFEFLALAKPAVLIPLPLSASRGDQILNAKYFVKKGYAEMIDQDTASPQDLTDAVMKLYDDRERYIEAMKKDSRLDGSEEIIEEIEKAAKAAQTKTKRK